MRTHSGDWPALEALYRGSRDDVYAYVLTLCGDAAGAEDAQLSARERELVALKFHAGLNNAEIARVLGVSESNAGTLLHRVITKLREAVNVAA